MNQPVNLYDDSPLSVSPSPSGVNGKWRTRNIVCGQRTNASPSPTQVRHARTNNPWLIPRTTQQVSICFWGGYPVGDTL